jgi:hypothetical protein
MKKMLQGHTSKGRGVMNSPDNIFAIAIDNEHIEIQVWGKRYSINYVLTNEQAKSLAEDILQIIKDGE